MAFMNAARYFNTRAESYKRLAIETPNPTLHSAYEAIAADMLRKAAAAGPDDEVILVGGVAVDAFTSPQTNHRPTAD